jgi:hypothetical protein
MPAPNGWSQGLFASLTGFQNIDALLIGSRWAGVVTYSFPTYGSIWSTSQTTGYGATSGNREPWSAWFSPLSSSDRPFFVSALQKWSSVTNLQVVETADTTSSVGDIRAAYTAGNGATLSLQAWAYPPAASSFAGDIWFNALGTSATSVWRASGWIPLKMANRCFPFFISTLVVIRPRLYRRFFWHLMYVLRKAPPQ